MLVAAGANLNMRDANGSTPMMLAFQADDHDLAAYLESMCAADAHLTNPLSCAQNHPETNSIVKICIYF